MVATHISMILEIGMATLNVNDISGKVELNGNLSGWMSAFGGFDTKAAFPDSPTKFQFVYVPVLITCDSFPSRYNKAFKGGGREYQAEDW
jgi:hypothetical protein